MTEDINNNNVEYLYTHSNIRHDVRLRYYNKTGKLFRKKERNNFFFFFLVSKEIEVE